MGWELLAVNSEETRGAIIAISPMVFIILQGADGSSLLYSFSYQRPHQPTKGENSGKSTCKDTRLSISLVQLLDWWEKARWWINLGKSIKLFILFYLLIFNPKITF